MHTADIEKYFKANEENWNDRVSIHRDSEFYDVEGFRGGKSSLNGIELSELGDVKDKSLLHLQCHFGLDTMSLSRMGARATGIDFSGTAIDEAKKINEELGLSANFICSNVYDLPNNLKEQFDIVFTSYGVIGWLPDLNKWANIINQHLKPGGTFFIAEFHPVIWMFDDDFTGITYSYFNRQVIEMDQESTYADKEADFSHKEYSWNHPLSDVVGALLGEGLQIGSLKEYDYSPYDCFPNMIQKEPGHFYIKGFEHHLPMVYSIKARKPF